MLLCLLQIPGKKGQKGREKTSQRWIIPHTANCLFNEQKNFFFLETKGQKVTYLPILLLVHVLGERLGQLGHRGVVVGGQAGHHLQEGIAQPPPGAHHRDCQLITTHFFPLRKKTLLSEKLVLSTWSFPEGFSFTHFPLLTFFAESAG